MIDESKPMFSGEILLCEDSDFARFYVKKNLLQLGFRVLTCVNGQEAVEMVTSRAKHNEKPFGLIIMNIIMPIMDGLEAAQTLLWRGSKIPMIALTTNTLPEDLELYKTHGITGHLNKPYTEDELIKLMCMFFTPNY